MSEQEKYQQQNLFDNPSAENDCLPEAIFGLTEFTLSELLGFQPVLNNLVKTNKQGFIINLEKVTWWDPAALLWFSLFLQHSIENGVLFKLKFPKQKNKDDIAHWKSGDFLRRWEYREVLKRVTRKEDISELLVDDQQGYFEEKQRFYLPQTLLDSNNVLQLLDSNRLLSFFDLTDPSERRHVSITRISSFLGDYRALPLARILKHSSSLNDKAEEFSARLVKETLENARDHPDADFAMIVINRSIKHRSITIAIADNGDSICATILDDFNQKNQFDFQPKDLERPDIAEATLLYAMKAGSKSKNGDGMGLHYVETDVASFNGTLEILTSGIHTAFFCTEKPKCKPWKHNWKGNLIRITLPINPKSIRKERNYASY